jgi:hypothetical protein
LGVAAGPLYLTVKVYPTDFADSLVQQVSIYVNDDLKDICRPAVDCGLAFYSCFEDMDVSDFVLLSQGGGLQIEVRSVGVYTTECDYEGYPLYVQMDVSDQLTTSTGNSRSFIGWLMF